MNTVKQTARPLKSIGIIAIATGKYFEKFIPNLKESLDAYFQFDGYQTHFYCFTDSNQSISGVSNIPVQHFAWPFSTLLRYRWIKEHLALLQQHDFLLYMDADMRVVSTPPTTMFDYPLIAVRHPGYVDTPGAFEIDRKDSCYVPPPLRKHYFQGCFWGGKRSQFCELINTLSHQVDDDLALGNIPIWHDESYLNHYLSSQTCKALPPTYAWPEAQTPSEQPYVLHLEKQHDTIRQAPQQLLNIEAFIAGGNSSVELEIYKKLYLKAHEKTQRLESRLVQKNLGLSKIREWLSYYRKSKTK